MTGESPMLRIKALFLDDNSEMKKEKKHVGVKHRGKRKNANLIHVKHCVGSAYSNTVEQQLLLLRALSLPSPTTGAAGGKKRAQQEISKAGREKDEGKAECKLSNHKHLDENNKRRGPYGINNKQCLERKKSSSLLPS